MTEAKKQIEDAVWNYILARRPLKIAMIVVSAIGVLSGALSALEKPIASAVSNAKYISGVLPPPDAVRQERGAFVAGRLLYEAQIAAGDQDRLRRLFDALEGSVRLAGLTLPLESVPHSRVTNWLALVDWQASLARTAPG